MVMVWLLYLRALSAVCVSVNAQFDEAANADFKVGFSSDGEFNSYFGADTCHGVDCAYETSSENSVPEEPQDEYEPHYPEHPVFPEEEVYPEPVYPEPHQPTTEYPETDESNICDTLLEASSEIESRHPDIKIVKFQILEELMRLAVEYSQVEGDNCDPAVKLLDIIIMAANKLKIEYIKESNTYCEFEVTEESSEYTTSDYDQMEGTGTPYPEVISPELVTEEYEPHEPWTEETLSTAPGYKPSMKPCSEQPIYEPSTEHPTSDPSKPEPCPDVPSVDYLPTEEIIAEDDEYEGHISPPLVGSLRGIPGEHYPNYTEVPITSFSCADKKFIPGFYADLETGCQVFHVCYEHRRESFLCPMGTIFNQPILACDYWYSSNCSLAPNYFEVNAKTPDVSEPKEVEELPEDALDELVQFLPVKAKVTVFTKTPPEETKFVQVEKPHVQEVEEVASDIFDKTVSTTRVVPKPVRAQVKVHIRKPASLVKPKLIKAVPVLKAKALGKAKFVGKVALAKAAIPAIAKAKIAAAVPVKILAAKAVAAAVPKAKLAAGKVVAIKAAVPVVAKAKLAAGIKFAGPVAVKGKFAAAAKVAVPPKVFSAKKIVAKGAFKVPVAAKVKMVAASSGKVALKTAPVLKGKILAASLPFAKSVLMKASIPGAKFAPVMKAKLASVPVLKGKLLALPLTKSKFVYSAPLVKAKLVKSAAISPLTKKALAVGYMKLLKAKKLALMG